MIEAADKSWSFRTSLEAHFRMLFEHGRPEVGRTNGEIMGRRFRPYFYYCINNCLYELEVGLDLDGFGTGNAKNSTNSATSSILQRGALHVHLEHLNPWMPTVDTGMDISTTGAAAISRQGSSATGVQREYDLMKDKVLNELKKDAVPDMASIAAWDAMGLVYSTVKSLGPKFSGDQAIDFMRR